MELWDEPTTLKLNPHPQATNLMQIKTLLCEIGGHKIKYIINLTKNHSSMKQKCTIRFATLLLAICALAGNLSAQGVVKGVVKDGSKEPMVGVSVILKSAEHIGTVTGADGSFSIDAAPNDVLVFSYLGMTTQEVKVGGRTYVEVVMKEDAAALDEIVVVGYGVQKRSSLTGAISTVSDDEILKVPTMSVSNMVGAKIAGISAVQSSGQPGSNDAALTVRGQSNVIYVIDGIRRTKADFDGLDPNEIESISVLKDASAVAVYGLDANGAFVVTTKKGANEKVQISYTGTVGISQNALEHDYLDGPEYAYWYNKAITNQAKNPGEPLFTAEQVQWMREGKNGWGNTDWYDLMWGTGVKSHNNISASGGNETTQFFTSLGYMSEQGNLDNFDYERFNLRANVNASLAKGLKLTVGMAGRVEDRNSPYITANPKGFLTVPTQICYALPYVPLTVKDADGREFYTATPTNSQPVSPKAVTQNSGYQRSNTTYVQTNFALQYDAPWLKGLSFKFQGAYDVVYTMSKSLRTPMEVMVLNKPTSATTELTYSKKNLSMIGDTPILSESAARTNDITSQTSITYNNEFDKHTIGILLLAETRQRKTNTIGATGTGLDFVQMDDLGNVTNLSYNAATGQYSEAIPTISGGRSMTRVAGFVGRLNYSYADKYYLEASMRYDGSYLFGGMNKRWVALPGVSAAWRINQEEWFDAEWVNNLKLRAGAGKTASSAISAFQWMNTMALNQNQVVIGGSSQTGITASTLGNPNLTWSQCMNYNVGVDATLWGGLLGIEADVFYKHEYDKLASGTTGAYPPSMGGYYFSSANVNEVDYRGFDLTFSHYNKIGDFNYGMKFIWSYAYARWLHYAGDANDTQDYKRMTGKQVGSQLSLIAEGLYQSWEEIENSAIDSSRPPYPGYIKYKDVNGDGKITLAQDQGYFSRAATPTHTGSLNLFAEWKGFDIDVLFSYGAGNDVALMGLYVGVQGATDYIQSPTAFTRPFYQYGNSPRYLMEKSWVEGEDNSDAEFPRLEYTQSSMGNGYCSTFWNRDGKYLRLKTAQVGYTFPKKMFAKIGIESLRIYAEGYNLFTWSELNKFNIDPEAPGVNNGYYPQQRTITMGLKVTF